MRLLTKHKNWGEYLDVDIDQSEALSNTISALLETTSTIGDGEPPRADAFVTAAQAIALALQALVLLELES